MKPFQVFRYIKKYQAVIIACSILAGVFFYWFANRYMQSYTASVAIEYSSSGADTGYAPDGSLIDTSEIYSSNIVTQAVENLGISRELVNIDAIRSAILVEEIITNQKTRQQMYYLHYEISDKTEINELVENFKWRIFNINRQDFIIKKDDQLRKILLCCSSGLTSSLFVMKLNNFCKEHNINYHFKAASIFDKEALNKEYDLLLMAPQVQHYTKGLANIFHQRILNIDPNDYGQYNCNNIIAKIQEIFL